MWDLDHKNGWVVVLEKTLKSPWDCKEIKPVNPKENQPLLEGLMLKLQYFGHLMQSQLIAKDPDAIIEDWRQKKKDVAENEVVR